MASVALPVRVIAIEDHPGLAYALRELLETDERLIVIDVIGAVQALLQHPYLDDVDVVLTDVHLPDFNGLELADELRATHPQIRVIVMSGSGDTDISGEALAGGAWAYLEKGAMYGEIADRIVEVAGQSVEARQLEPPTKS